ncbi:hypothetical protein NITGR_600008 [Nitrospina gracilis 3/211]|uniref:Uncharacterized protein n=1 Tax=Nitrospina gracilis (strain 3/211) TaxID=1266370 RepID=M1ZCW5_NITG3|nr:hypothetical protein NITGR_600008 [Nitrospina gracilis 3/211]
MPLAPSLPPNPLEEKAKALILYRVKSNSLPFTTREKCFKNRHPA